MKKIKEIFAWFTGLFSSSKKESWRVVLLCLLAGTTFWILNALNKDYTTKIDYPIEFVYDASEAVVVVEELPEKIEIDVSGGGWNLLRKTYWFNINPVNIPLNNPSEVRFITGSSLVPVISDQLSEISLNYVVTDTLYINIEEKISKGLKVIVANPDDKIASPYKIISAIETNPDTVIFTGPESFINELPDTLALDLPNGIEKNFDEDVNITINVSDLVSFSPEVVRVSFEVAPFVRETKVVEVQPINYPRDSSLYLVDDKVEVIYTVQESLSEGLEEDDFQILANFRNLNARDSTIDATLGNAPDFISNLKVNPKSLRVRAIKE